MAITVPVSSSQQITNAQMGLLASASNASLILQYYPPNPPFNQPIWNIGNISMLASGSWFQLGDVITDNEGYSSIIEIGTVTPLSGSVRGFRFSCSLFVPWNNGNSFIPTASYDSPRNGNKIILEFNTGSYIFPTNAGTASIGWISSVQNQGTTMNVGIVDGGIGYQISQSLYLPQISPAYNVIVQTTGSGGVITAISQSTNVSYFITGDPNFVYPSGSLTGSGAVFYQNYYQNNQQPNNISYGGWLAELNRLGTNITDYAQSITLPQYYTAVSGPWPSGGPPYIDNFESCSFYFPYRGYIESASLTCIENLSGISDYHSKTYIDYTGWDFTWQFATSSVIYDKRVTFIVGGTSSVLVSGSFGVSYTVEPGFYDTVITGPTTSRSYFTPTQISASTSTVSVVSTNCPGTFTKYIFQTGDDIWINIGYQMNQLVVPGEYYVETAATEPNDSATGTGVPGDVATSNNRVYCNPGVDDGMTYLVSSYTYTGQSPYPGVCTQSVYVMPISADSTYYMPASLACFSYGFGNAYQSPPYPDIDLSKSPYPVYGGAFPITWTMSTTGVWSAMAQPANQLNYLSYADMPWNLILNRVLSDGSTVVQFNPMLNYNHFSPTDPATQNAYNQTIPTEFQLSPPRWISGSSWDTGSVIVDNNLCLQQVSSSGLGGGMYPTFASASGQTTIDNNVTWSCIYSPLYLTYSSSWVHNTYYPLGATVNDEYNITWQNIPWNISQSLGGTSSLVINSPFIQYTASNGYRPLIITDTTSSISLSQSFVLLANYVYGSGSLPNRWQQITSGSQILAVNPTPKSMNTLGVPSYPYYWQSETDTYLIPPSASTYSYTPTAWGCGYQWNNHTWQTTGGPLNYDGGWSINNYANGYFIYKVILYRIGTNYDTANNPNILFPTCDVSGSKEQISVTIGCIQNGSFKGFGTYTTGQSYSVLWPIFNSLPLIYQAQERVQCEFWAINIPTNGLGNISYGYPMLADYYNTYANIINLLI